MARTSVEGPQLTGVSRFTSSLTRFAPVKPQRWVIASFEHHCGPHGLAHPHVHKIVVTSLTTGTASARG
jgi:hypothetical protein